ncbi:YicC family protein [Polynucleobacter sp. 78F-HAINBA]|uniref:YicC/YloC family endoribonuclease n=1 Tax=unclassified Polynucleobacter TaxID=2640945 RepID=UPI001C0AD2C5|nr:MULTISPECIES: YicC/YloC family endoribonuclease [unclassified Polynucleobacter]MBU3586490.1 YicC family protein [Polynucleobacter sp. 31A-FELB]MBU3591256.1 YicC family protein [Polynucleobacter sp. 78F-HAINBA]
MISSMTGYGSASRQVSLGAGVVADLQVECRAVNSRFLDLGFRLPDECRGAEPALREMATQSLSRGKVEFRAAWRVNSGAAGAAKANPHALGALNKDRLDALYTLQEHAQVAFPNAEALRIADILRWPGIVSEPRGEEEGWIAATVEAGRAALAALMDSRHTEGKALVTVLTNITSKMREIVKVIEPKVPVYVAQYQEKLTERLAEALAAQEQGKSSGSGTELMERIRQEVVLYAVRIDVAEEFARLKTHLQVVDTALAGKGPVGKRLDFLMQELNREANTLSSKSVSEECTQAALELKLLIEQMREQVQNLE